MRGEQEGRRHDKGFFLIKGCQTDFQETEISFEHEKPVKYNMLMI